MNFENLISKYLDSELTPEEDSVLRVMLAEDPAKKREFNEFVELHYLLKQDAQTSLLSEEDFSDIEDNFLMHIMVSQNRPKVVSKSNFMSEYLAPAMAVFLVFFVSIYSIFDVNLTGNSFKLQIPNLKLSLLKEEIPAMQISPKNNFSNINFQTTNENNLVSGQIENQSEISAIESDNIISAVNDSQSNTENQVSSTLVVSENNKEEILNSESQVHTSNSENIKLNESPLTSHFSYQDLNLLQLDYYKNNLIMNDLTFESNIFADLNRNGFSPVDNKKLNSFAQSVAIKINDNMKIGVELGVSNYEFIVQKEVAIPYNEIGSFHGDLSKSRRLPSGILTTIDSKIIYDNYFASVFVDSKIFESNYFSIKARAGLGMSNGGMLLTSRLYTEVPIYGSLHLLAGLDGRVFQNDNEFYNQNGIFNSNVSFISGLKFSF